MVFISGSDISQIIYEPSWRYDADKTERDVGEMKFTVSHLSWYMYYEKPTDYILQHI